MPALKTSASSQTYLQSLKDKAVFFDLEADGFLEDVTRIHCIGIGGTEIPTESIGPDKFLLHSTLKWLEDAEVICGHNIIGYDIPAIKKLHPWWNPKGLVLDTMVLTRLAHSNLYDIDWTREPAGLDKKRYGKHRLDDWGIRLGCHKGSHEDWSKWSQEMADYNVQDIVTTEKVYDHVAACHLPEEAIILEMELQDMIEAQRRHGFPFDIEAAQKLVAKLESLKAPISQRLQEAFPPIPAKCLGVYGNQQARAERELAAKGHELPVTPWDEAPATRAFLEERGIKFRWTKEQPFNPKSSKQIIDRLKAKGWEPIEFTKKGQPKTDADTLEDLGKTFPEAAPLVDYLLLQKRLEQIALGDNAWLKMVSDDGRMRGAADTMGTVTYRFTHFAPNMGQVPACDKPYGPECRGMFYAPPGFRLVGCDVGGLELCILAHYMAPWDRGEYIKAVIEGSKEDGTDVHSRNRDNADLETRDQAKTFIYAFLYGAGDARLGTIAYPKERSQEKLRKAGKALKSRFMRKTPALARLAKAVREKAAKQKKLVGLDGRLIPIRSSHSALNALIQSAGSIATKRATVLFRELMEADGHQMEKDWCLVAHVHDEWQTEVREEIAEHAARTAVRAIEEAGVLLGLRCPITGEAKIGQNWAETH